MRATPVLGLGMARPELAQRKSVGDATERDIPILQSQYAIREKFISLEEYQDIRRRYIPQSELSFGLLVPALLAMYFWVASTRDPRYLSSICGTSLLTHWIIFAVYGLPAALTCPSRLNWSAICASSKLCARSRHGRRELEDTAVGPLCWAGVAQTDRCRHLPANGYAPRAVFGWRASCVCQLDLAPFDTLIWPHLALVTPAGADASV